MSDDSRRPDAEHGAGSDGGRESEPNEVIRLADLGKKFTRELMDENEKLRMRIAELKSQLAGVRASRSSPEDMNALATRLRDVERERDELKAAHETLRGELALVEEENRDFAQRFVEVDERASNLVNLYVASYQLHATLDFDSVVQNVKEVLINLVGTEEFGIYSCEEDGKQLTLMLPDSCEGPVPPMIVADEAGPIGLAAQRGEMFLREAEEPASPDDPIACIPLTVNERQIGVIVVYRFLQHKQSFSPVDHELFNLLALQAATALFGALLYSQQERKLNTIEGFLDTLRIAPRGPQEG